MQRFHIKTLLFATTILGVGIAAPAMAQAVQGQASTKASPAEDDQSSVGDIIVTAQRREELQRDVPISITALNADMLSKAGVTNTLELGKVTPGVILPLYGAYVLPSIRGISSSGAGIGDSTNVAVYVDGVYQANQSAQLADLPDVQSIQVLKGPQGSLYGQNAAGGAIIIDTITPSFTWKGKASVGYGNFEDKTANGYVTGPLSPTLAIALSGAYRDRRGLSHDLLRGGYDNGLRAHQFRGKLLWQPNDGISLTLAAYYTKRADTGIYSGAPLNGNALGNFIARLPCNFGGLACLNLPLASGPREFAMNPAPDSRVKTYGFSMLGKFNIGDLGTLNTVTSYKKANVINFSDVDGTPVNAVDFYLEVKEHDFIQELNFTSQQFSGITISAGLFYLKKVEEYTPQISRIYHSNSGGLYDTAFPTPPVPIAVFGNHAKQDKNSYAAYVEVNYDLTDKLTLTAAGRYSYEKVTTTNSPVPFNYQVGDPLPVPLPDPRGPVSFEKFTPRVVLRYKPDQNNTLYASYSQGFKSGYVNTNNINVCTPSPACIDAPVRPEVVDAFEVGYKGKIAKRLELNISAFHYIYKDIQVFVFRPGPPPLSSYENAAKGKITGVELNATYRATPELTLSAGGSFLDAKYASFPLATVYIPNGFGNTLTGRDVTGNQLMRTPKWSGNGAINYTHSTAQGEFSFYTGVSYTSDVFYDPLNRVRQKAYALLDAELSFAPAAIPGARLVVWGKNLTNHDYLQSVLESQLSDAVSYADPRTYGVRLEYKF